jgi:folate-binding protein YgfZ
MNAWTLQLSTMGAEIVDGEAARFGDPAAERLAARDAAVMCDLSGWGTLRVQGSDAAAFLQGQLSNDVEALATGTWQLAAWCSAKGRVLAIFQVHRLEATAFALVAPAPMLPLLLKRLSMFVLRSRVTIADSSADSIGIGIGGPAAADVVAAVVGSVPAPGQLLTADDARISRLAGGQFRLVTSANAAATWWQRIAERARPAGSHAWRWLGIRTGMPEIVAATSDQFVPQALNLDALGAISFRKGCYTGQEIVARTQYLGRIKERLHLAHIDGAPPVPGDRLYSPAFEAQPCGTVIDAAPAPGTGTDMLAVMQLAAAESGVVHLQALEGPRIALELLPYALPAEQGKRDSAQHEAGSR